MSINLRVLVAVACFMVIAASAVVMARRPDQKSAALLVEIVPPRGVAATQRTPAGLELQVSARGLTLSLPDCDIGRFQDKFFLHLHTDSLPAKMPFINLDFYLAQERGKESLVNGKRKCAYYKAFGDFSVKEVNVGQFTTPNGRCCDITWSRSYVFDEPLLSSGR